MTRNCVLLFFTCLMLGCSSTVPKTLHPESLNQRVIAEMELRVAQGAPKIDTKVLQALPKMDRDALFFYLLRKEFSHWKGTPYQLGGNSKKGVDCSAFVQHMYRDSFNINLPRTTETQVLQGDLVHRDQLQVGDLVFFKTGWNTRHVGIYMGDQQFIHASTSKGVITSSLENIYWKPRYWQAKRILE